MAKRAKQSSEGSSQWKMAHMGLEFAGAALILALIGYYIDTRAGTAPWGAVIGLVLGVVGGMYRFIKEALAANRQYYQKRDTKPDSKPDSKPSDTDATDDPP